METERTTTPSRRAVEAGARGYVAKISRSGQSARRDSAGSPRRNLFPERIAAKIEQCSKCQAPTESELEVLRHLAAGLSNKEIMVALHLSSANIKLCVSNLLAKIGVQDRTQAAIEAVRHGLVRLV